MFLLRRPREDRIERFLEQQRGLELSYDPPGLSFGTPAGFDVDGLRIRIGSGTDCLHRARAAIDSWVPFDLGWAFVRAPGPPAPGMEVAVAAFHLGFWSLNGCRVLGRFPIDPGDRRYGFWYGTLGSHAERGEEWFAVEMDPAGGSVWYSIRAVSRPRALLAFAGYPYARRLQRRFRDDSARAVMRHVQN